MRLKLGRPDLGTYSDRFTVPQAADGTLGVTFLGVATLLIDDGESAVMTDGFFSRPGLLDVALRRIAPNAGRIDECLARAGVSTLSAVLPVHSHFDHVMDSAEVAARTGATLVGGTSTAMTGTALPADQRMLAVSGEPMTFGSFEITLIESTHCPPDRYPGVIDAPVVPPVKAGAYKCGEAWSIVVQHTSGASVLVQGSAGFVEGALAGVSAEVVYLGVGQLGVQSQDYIETFWRETVQAVGARQVVLIHWDDFFRPLTLPLRALPYAGDDLDVTMRVLGRLAERDGVALVLPSVWERQDPWSLTAGA